MQEDAEREGACIVCDVSTDQIVDPAQIGWVDYKEDALIVRSKVCVARNGHPYISLPTLYKRSVGVVNILSYDNKPLWEMKKKFLLQAFKNHVGAGKFYEFLRMHK